MGRHRWGIGKGRGGAFPLASSLLDLPTVVPGTTFGHRVRGSTLSEYRVATGDVTSLLEFRHARAARF